MDDVGGEEEDRSGVLFRIQTGDGNVFSAEVGWAALWMVSLLFLYDILLESLTICNAGLDSSSSSRSQQERMWRNQSPTFSAKLVFSEYMMFAKPLDVAEECEV
jgi:hypothetical protein